MRAIRLGDSSATLVFGLTAAGAVDLTPLEVKAAHAGGACLLGVGAGFAWLCELGLLPGTLAVAEAGAVPAHFVRIEGRPTAFTHSIPAGRILPAPVSQGQMRFRHPDPAALQVNAQIVLRWCDAAGGVSSAGAPGLDVAGVCDVTGRVVGLCPGLEPADLAQSLTWPLLRQMMAAAGV